MVKTTLLLNIFFIWKSFWKLSRDRRFSKNYTCFRKCTSEILFASHLRKQKYAFLLQINSVPVCRKVLPKCSYRLGRHPFKNIFLFYYFQPKKTLFKLEVKSKFTLPMKPSQPESSLILKNIFPMQADYVFVFDSLYNSQYLTRNQLRFSVVLVLVSKNSRILKLLVLY